jgi:hypothetical protein
VKEAPVNFFLAPGTKALYKFYIKREISFLTAFDPVSSEEKIFPAQPIAV